LANLKILTGVDYAATFNFSASALHVSLALPQVFKPSSYFFNYVYYSNKAYKGFIHASYVARHAITLS